MHILSRSIYKHGNHRYFLFLIGRFLKKIFSSQTASQNKMKLGRHGFLILVFLFFFLLLDLVIVPNDSFTESMYTLPNSFTTIYTCSCVTLEASKSRNLLRRSEIACQLKLPLNSCNFSFSYFIFTMCSVFSKAFISLSLSSKNTAFKSNTEWRVNIRKTFTKIKYSKIINTFDKIWRTNEIIYSTCIPASKFTYITITSYSSLHEKQVLSLAKIY